MKPEPDTIENAAAPRVRIVKRRRIVGERALAQALGVSRWTVARWVNGVCPVPPDKVDALRAAGIQTRLRTPSPNRKARTK